MIVPIEKIWERFENRYLAVNVVAIVVRRLKDEQKKGLNEQDNPIFEALKRLIAGKIGTPR